MVWRTLINFFPFWFPLSQVSNYSLDSLWEHTEWWILLHVPCDSFGNKTLARYRQWGHSPRWSERFSLSLAFQHAAWTASAKPMSATGAAGPWQSSQGLHLEICTCSMPLAWHCSINKTPLSHLMNKGLDHFQIERNKVWYSFDQALLIVPTSSPSFKLLLWQLEGLNVSQILG